MIKALNFIIILCFASTGVFAQHTYKKDNQLLLRAYQDTLIRHSTAIYSAQNNKERFSYNTAFVRTLVKALKTQNSFHYNFDSVKQISILRSPDNAFRIFSWQVADDDGTFRFFGTIQVPTQDGQLKLFPLIDGTDNFKDENEITDHKKWYGSRYYEIVPVTNPGKNAYYLLLGWKGNNQKTSKKVMEVLSFEKAQPVFGMPVFERTKSSFLKNRIIFEYNKLNSMTLRSDKKAGMIVFDHLVPFDPNMVGNFEYYASDSSFDGYKASAGKMKLIENIELMNDENELDELYIDPGIKNTPVPQ